MRHILIIGVGPGDPEDITVKAVNALNRANVIFIPDKGDGKKGLREQRLDLCRRYVTTGAPRFVAYKIPERAKETSNYKKTVADWHAAIDDCLEGLFSDELGDGESGAFLVWGDPCLYDSTLRIVESIHARGRVAFDYEIIPGVASVQALAARHKIALNRIGESVHITTGRRLAQGYPRDADSVVVMLDGEETFASIADEGLEIFWGANIGAPAEALGRGLLADVKGELKARRAQVKRAAGWVMDVYLLRKRREP